MAYEWSENLSVGVPVFDEQHRQLVERIHGLLDGMKEGRGREEIEALLDFLEEYVIEHFGAEERAMRTHGYPAYAAHKAQHDAFTADFCRLRAEIESGSGLALPVIEAQRRVCDWTLNHIGKTDRALGAYLKRHGG